MSVLYINAALQGRVVDMMSYFAAVCCVGVFLAFDWLYTM